MKILAIGAHFDDIELACGGSIINAVKKGHQVKMVIMTDSSYNNFDGKILRTKDQAYKEGMSSARVLGVKDVEILNMPIKDVPYGSVSVEAVDKIICKFDPDYIFTHWIFDTHQDHRNTGLATISAARWKNNILMYEPFPPSGRSYIAFRPQIYIDITDYLIQKIAALKKHQSQLLKYGEDNWIEATVGRARLRGFESYCKYAEVFEAVRMNLKF